MSQPSFEKSEALQRRLHHLVPGGAHTFARGSDQFPEGMAPVIERGIGARVCDVDGNWFVEYGMGMRAVTLGHAYAPVVEAVRDAIGRGVSFSRPSALEVAAAEDFLGLVTGADMVKFTKNASDATAAAVRLARAATGRDHVAVSDQPFFSGQDWFVGTLPLDAGVPAAVRELTHRFTYNDLESLRALLAQRPIACVIMEAGSATAEPGPGYLEGVRALCDAHGAVLVFDETITGFRWSEHGAQHLYGVTPDLSCWGKAMGNGFPISALAGKRELMELGGLRTDRDRVFLLSSTHGAETGGLAAFRAVVTAYRETDPIATMQRQGALLAEGGQRGGPPGRGRGARAGHRTALVSGVRDPRRRRAALPGLPHTVSAGDDPGRGARPVVRDLRGAHRRGRGAHRGGGAHGAAGLPESAGGGHHRRPAARQARRARPPTPRRSTAAACLTVEVVHLTPACSRRAGTDSPTAAEDEKFGLGACHGESE